MDALDLRHRRLAVAASKAELARVAGLSHSIVESLELGRRRGLPATWERVEGALVLLADRRADDAERVLAELAR